MPSWLHFSSDVPTFLTSRLSRDIVGVHKDGSLINFKITVTDKRGNGDERCFLAILQS